MLRGSGSPGHEFACHFPVGTPEGDEAFQRNLDAGVPQTMAAAGRVMATEDLDTLEALTARVAVGSSSDGRDH